MTTIIDNEGLDCLQIPVDESNRSFNCSETSQQKLINTTFWIVDIIEDVTTKHGAGRMIVKIKTNKEDKESDAKKFFTNSRDIKYILGRVKEMGKFPRKVTMRANGNRYYLE